MSPLHSRAVIIAADKEWESEWSHSTCGEADDDDFWPEFISFVVNLLQLSKSDIRKEI